MLKIIGMFTGVLLLLPVSVNASGTEPKVLYTFKSGKVYDANSRVINKSCYSMIGTTEEEVKSAYKVTIQSMKLTSPPSSKNIKPIVLFIIKDSKIFDVRGDKIDKVCYSILGVTDKYVKSIKYAEIAQSLQEGQFYIFKEMK
ncbi:hypothetical protein [Deinococcus puniceus]|uniref:hypothetical protein n=1 Tax=Deinococcus puniceus TaxID=1182568 RepID=UPI0012F90E69|nr:hypothetical protein [Deinococcus puniceus]